MGTFSQGLTVDTPKINNLIKSLISKSGKKYYELLIGKLNEPKIQNFVSIGNDKPPLLCIDLFVVIAWRENSIYYTTQFGKPVVTPYEVGLALAGLEWESRVITDFEICTQLMSKCIYS